MTSTAPVLALRLYDAMAGSITRLKGAIADRKMTGSSFGVHITAQDAKFKALDRGRGVIVDLKNYRTEETRPHDTRALDGACGRASVMLCVRDVVSLTFIRNKLAINIRANDT